MIKVIFKYKTKKKYEEELLKRFSLSADEKFQSNPSNLGIEMSKQSDGKFIIFQLDIYYNSIKDYEDRTKFERSHKEWNDIWFDKNNHELISTEVFEIIKEK